MSLDLELEEIHKLFFEESFEGLDVMESGLLRLDAGADAETINTIFRAAHSIKGGAATFGFVDVADFAHRIETLLDGVRSGARRPSAQLIEPLLRSVDGLREMLVAARDGRAGDVPGAAALGDELARLLAAPPGLADVGPLAASAPEAAGPAPAAGFFAGEPGWVIEFRPSANLLKTGNEPLRIIGELGKLGRLSVRADLGAVPPLASLEAEACYVHWHLELAGSHERRAVEEVFGWIDGDSVVEFRAVEALIDATRTVAMPAPGAARAAADAGSLRVSTSKVDHLLNLVGELVITQSMLSRFADGCSAAELEALRAGLAQLGRNTRELQESVMQIRMLPINVAFSRFPRLVHDLSQQLGKIVELRLVGEATELDKTVLEKLSDPLLHLVRNALDHGLETPAQRRAAGKPDSGVLELAAFHEGGNIIVEVRDDGAGLDRARILGRAIERGLLAAGAEPTEEEVHQLIFSAGFSTATIVSDVSGRGVGMDVVRRNIESLGGQVQIRSTAGHGSTIRIRLPLTLAILDGQLVRVGAETYVIALAAIVETIQAPRERLLKTPGGAELFRLREEYVPVVRICDLCGVEPDSREIEDGLLVVVEADGRRFGLLVDDLLAQQQVVIKSLEVNFRPVRGIAGGTILGDGAIALILDVPGLIHSFNATPAARRTLAA